MANYTREEINAYVDEYLARQTSENIEFRTESDPAQRSALEKKYRRTAKREFIFKKYLNHDIDEEKMQPQELNALAQDFGHGKGMVGYGKIEDFESPEYNTIVANLNDAMLARLDDLPADTTAEEIIRKAPFLELLADARFSLDQDDQQMIEKLKSKVDLYLAENKRQTEQTAKKPAQPEKSAKKSDREIGLNGEEFNLLRDLTAREQKLSGGELLHKALEVSQQIAQKYEAQRRYDLGMEISAAFLKRFAVSAIRYKKINQWRLEDTDKQLLLEFLTHPVKARHLPEEQLEQVKGWVLEAIEGRRGNKNKSDTLQKENEIAPQTGKKILKKKTAETGVISYVPAAVVTAQKVEESSQTEEEETKELNIRNKPQIVATTSSIEEISSVMEKNLSSENIAFKRIEDSEKQSELAYDLYSVGKNPKENQPSGKVIFRKPNDAVLISEEFPHYLSVVKTLRDNGCKSLKIGTLSDDNEKNLRFKASLVLAGATLGMATEGLDTAEKLEELKAFNPNIELLIEKRKFRQKMKDLRIQFEETRKAGNDTSEIEKQIQEKIAAGVQKYVEKGSIDPSKDNDSAKRLKRVEELQAKTKPGTTQAAFLQKALTNMKTK